MPKEAQESCFSKERQGSLLKLSDSLMAETKQLLQHAKTEEDLRIGFEKILDPIKQGLGITAIPKYENNQLVDYLSGESEHSRLTKLIGVGFDGETIFFVQYQGKENLSADKVGKIIDKTNFILLGPYSFNLESARTLLIHLRALTRLPLTAENLAQKFGPQSELAPKAVATLTNALKYWGDQTRIHTFFNEWKRLFGIVYGEQFSGQQEKEAEILSKLYKVSKGIDFQELLFSVHTYFAFLMKIISAELLTLRETTFIASLASELAHASEDKLKRQLIDIEDGGIYTRKGITNFLEGDFFRWYLDAWNPELKDAIQEIARALSEFEPATSTLDPSAARDLLKKLYQYLVPQEVRHRLGEYYTPDWLAELILNEVDYDGNTLKRFLDPACGSGTFVVLAIQRANEYGVKEKLPPLEIAKRIVANIWGFDLNPLAVIAARTNYLFALGNLANELPNIEIPIYLADSVLWPEMKGQMSIRPEGESIEIQTSLQKFYVPKIWIVNNGFLMKTAAPLIERMVREQYSVKEAMEQFKKNGLVFPPHEKIVEYFYKEILEIEKQGKNGIWARFLKNIFAPIVAEKFDFVVGNPPWVRWDYLSQSYRNATLKLWKDYGLFSLKGFQTRLGGGKKDFSMLFVYASADYYLKDGGKLGFLITQEVFKSKGAGEGFRRFQLGNEEKGKYLKVLKAHDLASIQPFEGATNKTAAIILRKGEKTKYPVPYIVWTKKKGVGKIATELGLNEALPLLQKKRYLAKPIGSIVSAWQTQPVEAGELKKIGGKNYYRAYSGIIADPYGVFWVKIVQVFSDGSVIVNNLPERGKRKIPKIEARAESGLIYPSLRGADIQRWQTTPKFFVFLTQDPYKREPLSEAYLKNNFPRTYSYFTKFKEVLMTSSSKMVKRLREQKAFYSMFGVGDYTVSQYKVVWKQMSNDIYASVISQTKTQIGYKTVSH
ncbi:MAG: N-6 DNA methylase [Candidatus Stahlbacteria bacterium]|nr:N-6 DNA methylase [Candidatus Stahlbacteria bacterium]